MTWLLSVFAHPGRPLSRQHDYTPPDETRDYIPRVNDDIAEKDS